MRVGALVWSAALAILAIYVILVAGPRTTHGFIAYYAASRLLVSGALGPSAYDDEWFMRYVQQITGTGVLEVFGPNPPTMALLALPVVAFDSSSGGRRAQRAAHARARRARVAAQ